MRLARAAAMAWTELFQTHIQTDSTWSEWMSMSTEMMRVSMTMVLNQKRLGPTAFRIETLVAHAWNHHSEPEGSCRQTHQGQKI